MWSSIRAKRVLRQLQILPLILAASPGSNLFAVLSAAG